MNKPNREWKQFIPDGSANKAMANYWATRGEREQDCATPSSIMSCPRTVWLAYNQKLKRTNEMGWGKKQRNMAGRMFENLIAMQYQEAGQLLHHWQDDEDGQSEPFEAGTGLTLLRGTPDLLLQLDKVSISDAKTARGDGFAYVPLNQNEAWKDALWLKNKVQLDAYFLLAHKNKDWFAENELPLPEQCHLFSYALDDGIVRREFTWTPTKEDIERVKTYTIRWNTAYKSETMPDCACSEDNTKFCPFASEFIFTKSGYKLGSKCCDQVIKEKQSV